MKCNVLVEIKPPAAKMGTTLLERLVVSSELRSRVGRRTAAERRQLCLSLSGASVLEKWCGSGLRPECVSSKVWMSEGLPTAAESMVVLGAAVMRR